MASVLGVVSDTIQIANALGYETPGQKKLSQKLLAVVKDNAAEMQGEVRKSTDYAARVAQSVHTAVNEQFRELVDRESFTDEEAEDLIKLVMAVRTLKGKVVLGLVIKYKVGQRTVTNGFALTSYSKVSDMIESVTRTKRALVHINVPVTSYLAVRVRGRHSGVTEHHGLGILGLISSGCLGLDGKIRFETAHTSMFEAIDGGGMVYLMRDVEAEEPEPTGGYDVIKRVMLLGDTRTGKSTLGNALMGRGSFRVARGMTGTMHIDKDVTTEQSGSNDILTEYYDTPGLNDRDGLDPMYEAAIEDKIVTLQRVSTLVVTVSIDGGLTGSFDNALKQYRKLFGTDMFGMLIVVLTVNDNISDKEAEENIEINWPNIAGKSTMIRRDRVYCIGLKGLRDGAGGSGEQSLSRIRREILRDRMVLISSIRQHHAKLQADIRKKKQLEEAEVSDLIDNGWQTFEELEKLYWTKPYVKVAEYTLSGFVMKQGGVARMTVSLLSGGMINKVRKYAINVVTAGSRSIQCWLDFLEKVPPGSHDCDALTIFGDMIDKRGLAVLVSEDPSSHVGTMRLTSWTLTVIDPTARIGETVLEYIGKMLEESEADIREDIAQELIAKETAPRFKAPRRKKLRLPFP